MKNNSFSLVAYLIILAIVGINTFILVEAPDLLSAIFIVSMLVMILLGFYFGLYRMIQFCDAFDKASIAIAENKTELAYSDWVATLGLEKIFSQKMLDGQFDEYKEKLMTQRDANQILSDIEEYFNEEFLASKCWNRVVSQVPGSLTGLGILGTFVGLIIGISNIGFNSQEAAIESVANLVAGIQLAFYTSIAGLILSVCFNIYYRVIWNILLSRLSMFQNEFRKRYIPSTEEQERYREQLYRDYVLEKLDRIPKDGGTGNGAPAGSSKANPLNSRLLMPQIVQGIRDGEFDFILRKRHDIYSKQVVSTETLIRWTHKKLGVISPSIFLPIIKENGMIAKIHRGIWEDIFNSYRWDVPVGLKVYPSDLLTDKENLGKVFKDMTETYNVPPAMVYIEINYDAFGDSSSVTIDSARELRRQGFKVIIDKFDGNFVPLDVIEDLPVDELKLELSGLDIKESCDLIKDAFMQARKRNLRISASGIRSIEQVTALKKSECMVCDGVYYSEPVSLEEYYG